MIGVLGRNNWRCFAGLWPIGDGAGIDSAECGHSQQKQLLGSERVVSSNL